MTDQEKTPALAEGAGTRPDLDALIVQEVAAAIFETRDDDSDLREWGDEVDGEERERYECDARAALTILGPAIAAERARADEAEQHPRDEYHTMEELYEYRMLYNALAFNAWAHEGKYDVVKSWRHSDGELCFGGGWFVVAAVLPTGLISNHYRAEHWDLFRLNEGTPPPYDGHTPEEAARRMRRMLLSDAV